MAPTAGSPGGQDRRGNPMSGDRDAVARHDRALERLLRFDTATLDLVADLDRHDADVPMTHVLHGYLALTSTDHADVAGARQRSATVDALGGNEREAAHAAALAAWASGRWAQAARLLDQLLARWPTDLLALMVGQQLDFFVGDAANLRDRPARSLPAFDPADPDTGIVRGLLAFGLEESGQYRQAEEQGLAALEANRDDVWAVHAVTHVCEMEGRVDDGARFLLERRADWAQGNLFTVHNWWHLALFCLEAGRVDAALSVYDREIHHDGSAGVPIEMLDASALLWRLHLDGADTGDRFAPLARAWERVVADEPWYAFNDVHAVMAFVGADRLADARAVVDRLAAAVAAAPTPGREGTNAAMMADVGLPACRALVAHGEGRWSDAAAELAPARHAFHHFGGSHAQRDALQRTLLDAVLRSGDSDAARSLLDERLALRPTSVHAWSTLARSATARGDDVAAVDAASRAAVHRTRFAAALPASL